MTERPLSARFAYFMPRAFNENVIYRLFVFSTATYALARLRGKTPSELEPAAVWGVMMVKVSPTFLCQKSAWERLMTMPVRSF